MRIAGIDPGINGGIAVIDSGHAGLSRDIVLVDDLPVMRDKSLSWIDGGLLAQHLRASGPNVAVIERVSAMPKQGVSSSFHFGMAFGSILSVVQALHIPIVLVTPVSWKRDMGLPGNKDKKTALNKARLLYPSAPLLLEKHHNRGEALLIAHWYATRTSQQLQGLTAVSPVLPASP